MQRRFRLRRSEWLITAYLVYTTVLAWALPVRPGVPVLALWVNAVVIAGFFIAAYGESLRGSVLNSVLRDWYVLPLALLTYREMGWLAPATHSYALEQGWVTWDRLVLGRLGAKAAIESLGPILPSILEVSYTLVYTMPVLSMAILYASGRRDRSGRYQLTFFLATLGSYALFPLFPSEPPRTVFPGDLFPEYLTPFRRFNWAMLSRQGIHTSVFPSAHVSGAFSSAFALMRVLPERPWAGRALLILATLIATATVYGRYHYLVDALAGLCLAAAAEVLSRIADRRAGIRSSKTI